MIPLPFVFLAVGVTYDMLGNKVMSKSSNSLPEVYPTSMFCSTVILSMYINDVSIVM